MNVKGHGKINILKNCKLVVEKNKNLKLEYKRELNVQKGNIRNIFSFSVCYRDKI